jgi:hypothetical protein
MTEDQADAKIAELFDEPEVKPKKRYITDEETIADMDRKEREEQGRMLEEAAGMFLTHERDFWKIAVRHDVHVDSLSNCIFWDRLHALSESERTLQRIFMGRNRRWNSTVYTDGFAACCWRVPDWRRTHD